MADTGPALSRACAHSQLDRDLHQPLSEIMHGSSAAGKLEPCAVGCLFRPQGGAYLRDKHVWSEGLAVHGVPLIGQKMAHYLHAESRCGGDNILKQIKSMSSGPGAISTKV
eukprot:1154308-Pelagomonas_calceolata.AAC.2